MKNKRVLKIVAILTTVFFIGELLVSGYTNADNFMDAVNSGSSLGTVSIDLFKPQNLNSTLQNKGFENYEAITPKIVEGKEQESNFTSYYSNPGGLNSAANAVEGYTSAASVSVYDGAFGTACKEWDNVCLEYEDDGVTCKVFKCKEWYKSKQILLGSEGEYTCTKQYEEIAPEQPPEEVTCLSGAGGSVYCPRTNYVEVVSQTITTPCAEYTPPPPVENQIFESCRDVYDYYLVTGTVYTTEGWGTCDMGICSSVLCTEYNADTAVCYAPFVQVDTPPDGASWVGYKWWCTHCIDKKSGDDWVGKAYYPVYRKYKHSVIEKLILHESTPCNYKKLVDNCSIVNYEACNTNLTECTTIVQDGEPLVENYSVPCESVTGQAHNYQICPGETPLLWVTKPGGWQSFEVGTQISVSEYDVKEHPSNASYIHIKDILGGSDILKYLGAWGEKVTFVCGTTLGEECEAIEKTPGCYHYSQSCFDNDCNVVQHVYHCGGAKKKVNVKYVCTEGGIKCIGTECKTVAMETNEDLAALQTAEEVIKEVQANSQCTATNELGECIDVKIFPGQWERCKLKSSVGLGENCCKSIQAPGLTIVDYYQIASAMKTVYSYLIAGQTLPEAVLGKGVLSTIGKGTAWLAGESTSTITLNVTAATEVGDVVSMEMTTTVTQINETITIAGTEIGTQTFTAAITTIATAVAIAMAAYAIIKIVGQLMFGCDEEDMRTSIKNGYRLCTYVKQECAKKALGKCLQKQNRYCCFSSILARIIQEQGRYQQLGIPWEEGPCRGLTPQELGMIDFSKIDLSEYMQYVEDQYLDKLEGENLQNAQNKIKQKITEKLSGGQP